MKKVVVLGSALASFTCEQFGTELPLSLTQGELDGAIQRFVDLVDFGHCIEG